MFRNARLALTVPALFALSLANGCVVDDDGAEDLAGEEVLATEQANVGLPRTAFVHLFEWKWTDIAKECETFLGPKGFAGVQVSPPNEHQPYDQWYARYQPVSYKIESRSGTRAEFEDMVKRCKAVGVGIYVDAVVNHMSGADSGVGNAGTSYTHYNYPGLYSPSDFHYCGTKWDDIYNYGNRWEVQNCELSNLADLRTESDYVRGRIAGYMNDLVGMGVAGFRIDAAKHIPAGDLAAIKGKLAGSPFIYQEVIDQGGEPITAGEYFGTGDVTEFKYSVQMGNVFKYGKLADLSQFGASWGFMPSDSAIVFVDNHDNQRGHGGGGSVVTHKDGALYDLANVFMLAWPYGYPQVMSSYAFTDPSQGPPKGADGKPKSVHNGGSVNCFGSDWVCEHRWRPITSMVQFRNVTASAFFTSNWWSNGNNQISFSRGDKGFVALNREGGTLSRTFQTGLAAGSYCDVISGDISADGLGCSGKTITVQQGGWASITVEPYKAVALHVGQKLGSAPAPEPPPPDAGGSAPSGTVDVSFQVNATTVWGQNVYVVGNTAAIGNWDASKAVVLNAASYPVWKGTVKLPAGASIQYKYIKRDGQGSVVWESGANRVVTLPSSGTKTLQDTWK